VTYLGYHKHDPGDRRYKAVHLNQRDVISVLASNNRLPGNHSMKVSLDVPPGTEIVGVAPSAEMHDFMVVLWNAAWPISDPGSHMEAIYPEYALVVVDESKPIDAQEPEPAEKAESPFRRLL
jgi:hypothetical protein